VQSPATDDEVEDTLNFQLEELSKMADDELSLIPKMAEWQPWDVPEGGVRTACWTFNWLQTCDGRTRPGLTILYCARRIYHPTNLDTRGGRKARCSKIACTRSTTDDN